MKYFSKKIIFFVFFIAAFFGAVVYCFADSSPDAIATRVMPNLNHLSASRWYQAKGFSGSPQAITVDGYEAVRDGRTVYINAANVDKVNHKFYTNIYIISYNQTAVNQTVDIFGQLLAHWKFNTNLSNDEKIDARDDTKRLADLSFMNSALDNYNVKHNNNFPALGAGSYKSGKSISTWPSWQAALGKELGVTLPVDPINELGACPGYLDTKTCWNQTDKTFYFNFNTNNQDQKSILKTSVYWYAYGVFHVNLRTNLTLEG